MGRRLRMLCAPQAGANSSAREITPRFPHNLGRQSFASVFCTSSCPNSIRSALPCRDLWSAATGSCLCLSSWTGEYRCLPWSEATFQACVELLARLHTSMPSHARRVLANGVWSQVSQAQFGWRYLALHDEEFGRLRSLFVDPNAGGRWLERYISTFGDLEKEAASLQAPSSWIHCDVRSDNLIFAHDGKPKLLDWPMLSLGPALLDLAFFLPSVAGEGGPSPGQGLALYERNVGRKFDEHGLRVIVAIVAGFFAARAGEPPMPELPRLRWLQSLYLAPCLIWVSSLLGIDPPPPLESPSGK